MTVEELIAELKKYNGEIKVYGYSDFGSVNAIDKIIYTEEGKIILNCD